MSFQLWNANQYLSSHKTKAAAEKRAAEYGGRQVLTIINSKPKPPKGKSVASAWTRHGGIWKETSHVEG